MRQNPHVRICGGPGSATTLVYPTSRLGHYNVTALIGEGGMGQVYRARDTKLDRDVALKVLPEAFADCELVSVPFAH